MILNKKESTLLLTIQGLTPLDYKYIENEKFPDISNKLLFLYPNITRLTSITHDMIRLVQSLKIDSWTLSNLILSLNYGIDSQREATINQLYRELYSIICLYKNKDLKVNKSGMIENELAIEDELAKYNMEISLKLLKTYYVGSQRAKDGYDYLFENYIKDKTDLTIPELEYLETYFSSYKINPNKMKTILKQKPVLSDENKHVCYRLAGECENWGKSHIKVYFSIRSEKENHYNIRYYEQTSNDDYSQNFYIEDMVEHDMLHFVKYGILEYLNEKCIDGMKNKENFKKYFIEQGVDEKHFDFN